MMDVSDPGTAAAAAAAPAPTAAADVPMDEVEDAEEEEDVRELEEAYDAAVALGSGAAAASGGASSSSPSVQIEAFRAVLRAEPARGGADGPRAAQIKERALYDLARLLCKSSDEDGGGVGPIVELVTGADGRGGGGDKGASAGASSAAEPPPHYLSTLSKAKCAKVVRHILDIVCSLCPPSWQEQVASSVLEWTVREKRGFLRQRVESRLARIYYDQGRFVDSLRLCDELLQELKKLDDKQLLLETHLLESQVYYALRNPPKSKAALTSCRTAANAVYVSPALQAEIDVMSGTLHTSEGDYKTGHSYFLEAFEQLDALADAPKATAALKYMMLCRILDGLKIALASSKDGAIKGAAPGAPAGTSGGAAAAVVDLSSLLTPKQHLKYAGRDVDALQAVAGAASRRDLAEYDSALRQYSDELRRDLLVRHHLRELRTSLLEANLVRVVEPYEVVQLSHVASQMKMPVDEVERKCSQMILDGKLSGILDQGSGHLVLYEDPPKDAAMEKGLQVLANVDGVVTSLFERSKALRTMMM